MPPKKRKIPPHPSGMAEPPKSKEFIKYEKRREVAKKFFDSAETRGDITTPSIQGALDKLPKTASVGLSATGELLINNHSRDEFHAHGCPFEFRNYKYDSDESWTVDGCVGEGDMDGGWYFEGTLTENTVKGKNGGRKCDIELRKPAFKAAFEKLEFTLTNCMRKGVKEKVSDFIMGGDHKELKQQIIDEVFCYYS